MTSDANADDNGLPLAGVTVIDFSRHLPGPWATQYLGDLGADVIKVEHKGIGDPSRYNPPRYKRDSVYFHAVNSGKRSLAIDLGHPDAADVKRRLLARADIVVETFRPGGAAKLGVGYEDAKAANPKIIYCSISGFGQHGPYVDTPGHDLAIQSLTGLLGTPFDRGEAARNPPFHASDYAGGTTAVIGILSAYLKMLRTGKSVYVDIPMYDATMSMLEIRLSGALGRMAGVDDEREIEVWGTNPRYRTYATKDGRAVTVGLLEAKVWAKFCNAIGRPDLIVREEKLEDRLTSHGARTELFRSSIAAYCSARTRDEIVAEMLAQHIPVTPVLDPDEAVSSEIAKARNIVSEVEDPVEGRVLHLNNPLQHSGLTRGRYIGPGLGADNETVLAELGYSGGEIQGFKTSGVV